MHRIYIGYALIHALQIMHIPIPYQAYLHASYTDRAHHGRTAPAATQHSFLGGASSVDSQVFFGKTVFHSALHGDRAKQRHSTAGRWMPDSRRKRGAGGSVTAISRQWLPSHKIFQQTRLHLSKSPKYKKESQ